MTAGPVIVDPLFDGAVARDLSGNATENDTALLYEDPWTWRKLLGIRMNIVNTASAPSAVTVDVTDSNGRAWSFRAMVRGMDVKRRNALMATLQARAAFADKMKRDMTADRVEAASGMLSGLVRAAIALVPRTTPEGAAWHEDVATYCERFRDGVPFKSGAS